MVIRRPRALRIVVLDGRQVVIEGESRNKTTWSGQYDQILTRLTDPRNTTPWCLSMVTALAALVNTNHQGFSANNTSHGQKVDIDKG